MKVVAPIALLALVAAGLGAQQTPPKPPLRPVAPMPAPMPLPTPDIAISPIVPDFDLDLDLGLNEGDLQELRLQARELADQARDQARLALQDVDVQQMAELARQQAELAMASPDVAQAQDLARLDAERAVARIDLSGLGVAGRDEPFAHAPRAPWAHDDPADSLYRLAREAFNTGNWRRAADLFHDVVQQYPGSAYAPDCAYYEAFSRYRIGTTDELHQALSLLSDQKTAASRRSRQADVAALAARIRGALAARGDQQAAAQIAQDAEKSGTCDREEMSVKAEALNALGQMDPAAATPLLQQVLQRRDTCSLQLRRSALFLLVRRGDTVATRALISVATNDHEDTNLRADAITYLGRLPGPEPLATLERLVKSDTDEQIQRAAVRALAQNDNPAARQSVRALVGRTDLPEALRAEAILSIASRDATTDDAAFLRTSYPQMSSERLKRIDLEALERIGGAENEQFLLGVARNPAESSEVRGTAIGLAGRSNNISVADLSKLYDASESRNLREQIIGVLGQRSEPEAADKLMSIVKTGTDPTTRRVAISVLSRKKDDPRVTKFLLDLVGR